MNNKSKDLNPKNEIWNNYKLSSKSILSKHARNVYKDKFFKDEYKNVYFSAIGLRFVANLISSITLLIATYLCFNTLFGAQLSIVLGVLFCILFENLKNKLWGSSAKEVLKYKKYPILGITTLCTIHLISLLGSGFGAWNLPQLIEQREEVSSYQINIDSISKESALNIATIDKQINQLQSKIESSTVRRIIKELTTQKGVFLDAQNIAIKDAKDKNDTSTSENKELASLVAYNHKEKVFNAQLGCLIGAVFFELLYLVCALFIAYYLFRCFIDDSEPTKTEEKEENGSKEEGATPHQTPGSQRAQIIGFRQNDGKRQELEKLKYTRVCALDSCRKPFTHSIHNQRFCSHNCRQKNHLLKKT